MTADRRLYSMDLGRRDHTRWLGSNRYAGSGPPPFSYADIPNQLLRINSLEGSLAHSGGTLTGVTDVSPVGGTVTVTGSPVYTASDADLNGAPSLQIGAAAGSVIAPNVNRANIWFAAGVFVKTNTTSYDLLFDGTVAFGRVFLGITNAGQLQTNFYTGSTPLSPSLGRKRVLFARSGSVQTRMNSTDVGVFTTTWTAVNNGVVVGDRYGASGVLRGSRVAFLMLCSSVPSAPLLAALEAKLITDFG